MSKNLFGLVLELEKDDTEYYPLTIGGVRRWVKKEYGLDISKSSVCAVRGKCGAEKLEFGAGKIIPKLKSDKGKSSITSTLYRYHISEIISPFHDFRFSRSGWIGITRRRISHVNKIYNSSGDAQ